jgi:hypothetical protein
MKRLLPLALCLLLLGASRNARPDQHQKRPQEHPNVAEQRQPEPTVPLSLYKSTQTSLGSALHALQVEQEAHAKEKRAQYEPWYTPSVLIQIGLLVVGILYTLFAKRQWEAIKEQARLTEETLIADKRAFVFADGLQRIFDPPDTSGVYNWRLRPIVRNSGSTPTRDLESHVHCEIRNDPLPSDYTFVYDQADIGKGMIGPQSAVTGGVVPSRMPITPQDIIDSQHGRRFIYLWGRIQYFDVFANTPRHTTHFCWLILVTGNPAQFNPTAEGQPPAPGTIYFHNIQHREGNYAN